MKIRNPFVESEAKIEGHWWSITTNRRGCAPVLLVLIGVILCFYFLSKNYSSDDGLDEYVVGVVIDSGDRLVDYVLRKYVVVKLPNGETARVLLPIADSFKFGSRVKLGIDRDQKDENGNPDFKFIDYAN